MDFVMGLPKISKGFDAIWVIVVRLTKSSYFLSIQVTYFFDRLAQLYFDEIMCLHGVPISIVSDRDSRFASIFWRGLQDAMGTKLCFNTTFHPQTDK